MFRFKNHCLPQIDLRKTVIQFLGIRNEYTKSIDLMIFVFKNSSYCFAFRSILYRKHLQISIFHQFWNSFVWVYSTSVDSCIELLHCVRDC